MSEEEEWEYVEVLDTKKIGIVVVIALIVGIFAMASTNKL